MQGKLVLSHANRENLYLLSLAETIERFAYFGLFTILVLKLHLLFHFTDAQGFGLFGSFIALSYTSLVVAGYITDRWIAEKQAIIFGGIVLIIANLLLASNSIMLFYLGLSFVIIGTSFFKVNCTALVGKLYQQDPIQKERAYTLFYSAMNFGGLLGAVSCGFLIEYFGWRVCFYLNALLILAVTLTFTLYRVSPSLTRKSNLIKPLLLSILYAGLLWWCFRYINYSPIVLAILWLGVFVAIFKFTSSQKRTVKKHLLIILLLNLGCVFFFACSLQVGSSITLFIQREIPRYIGSILIPTSSFSALDPFFVVLMAPVFVLIWKILAKKQIYPNVTSKIAIGIVLAALGFVTLSITAHLSHTGHEGMFGILIANIFLGAGEICITPAVLSAINQYSPQHLQSTMMGLWYVFIAIAGFIAGQLAKLSALNGHLHLNNTTMLTHYADAFLKIAALTFCAAAIVYSFKFLLKKLLTP